MSQKQTPYFELRSGAVDLLQFIVKTADLGALEAELTRRFEATPEFFADDVVAIDVRRLAPGERVSVGALVRLLERVRMKPVGVVADSAQREWALQGGLPLVEAQERRIAKAEPAPETPRAVDAAVVNGASAGPADVVARAAGTPVAVAAPVAERRIEIVKPTLIVDKPLRSGQQVFSTGDLVVLALVSYGAEVIAEGNIHIYAPLRGRALAGVHGNHDARIFCTCLEPELVSIAGIYRTTENPLPPSVLGQSVQIWLDDEKLIIEPLRLK